MPYKCSLFNYLLTFFILTDFAVIRIFLLNPTMLIHQSAFPLGAEVSTQNITRKGDCISYCSASRLLTCEDIFIPPTSSYSGNIRGLLCRMENWKPTRIRLLRSFKGNFSWKSASCWLIMAYFITFSLIIQCI